MPITNNDSQVKDHNLTNEQKKDLDKLRKPGTIVKMILTIPLLLILGRLTELLIRMTKYGRVRVFDRHHFDFEHIMEQNWEVIRGELDSLLEDIDGIPGFRQIHRSLTVVDTWKSHMFYGYGHKMERNCAVCPETTQLLEQIPNLNTAMFSILPPGTKLPPHTGIYNGILRYHLGLRIPGPVESCGLRVEGQIIHWKEGEGFTFDNRYEHEAWNNSDEVRVVLFLDFLRPLPSIITLLNKTVVNMISRASFVKEARRNIDRLYHEKEIQ